MDDLIVKAENESPDKAIVLILEDHISHVIAHLPCVFKKGMISHIVCHLKMHRKKTKIGLPTITLQHILRWRNG